jgi:farnesyl-diphosphate farnesyltransferase
MRPGSVELEYQARALDRVSRTFALTIPTLPAALRIPVTNAYLLCRIADTIEDNAEADVESKRIWGERFVAAVRGQAPAPRFEQSFDPGPIGSVQAAEHDLLTHCAQVLQITHSLAPAERNAMERCVSLMSAGMQRFQGLVGLHGLPNMRALDEYCYYVAGVVGEMLTELFCAHSPEIEGKRKQLERLAPSFGQGLQMTNILKDIWEDRARGTCWLPRSEFGLDPAGRGDLVGSLSAEEFRRGLGRLVTVAHGHLNNALEYTLLIPPRFRGIRRFCLWALGMAVPTLDNIHHSSNFSAGQQVKISRKQVRRIVQLYGLFAGQDRIVRHLFRRASSRLPLPDPEVRPNLEAVVRAAAQGFEQPAGPIEDRSLDTIHRA